MVERVRELYGTVVWALISYRGAPSALMTYLFPQRPLNKFTLGLGSNIHIVEKCKHSVYRKMQMF
jgi:hypothetical protein